MSHLKVIFFSFAFIYLCAVSSWIIFFLVILKRAQWRQFGSIGQQQKKKRNGMKIKIKEINLSDRKLNKNQFGNGKFVERKKGHKIPSQFLLSLSKALLFGPSSFIPRNNNDNNASFTSNKDYSHCCQNQLSETTKHYLKTFFLRHVHQNDERKKRKKF